MEKIAVQMLLYLLALATDFLKIYKKALSILRNGLTEPKKLELNSMKRELSIFQQIGSRAYEAKALLALAKTSLLINTVGKRHCRISTIQDYLDRAEKISLEMKLPLLTEVEKMKSEMATKETGFFN